MYYITSSQVKDLQFLYAKYLGYMTDGIFVEVGGFDGETHSNTVELADLGWRGYYIEPVPEHAELCKERHKNNKVTVIQLAVGTNKGIAKLSVAGEISTTLDNPNEFFNEVGLPQFKDQHKGNIIRVPQDSLEEILFAFKIQPGFELLTLDTEGTEWQILRYFDLERWKPKMVIIEMHEQSPQWTKIPMIKSMNEKLNDYFQRYNYSKVYSDDINSIFVISPSHII